MNRRPKDSDEQLRERFQALRSAEAGTAPPFNPEQRPGLEVFQPRRSGLRFGGRLAWGTMALVGIALFSTLAMWIRRPAGPSVEEAIAMAKELQAWTAPTDALLLTSDLSLPGSSGSSPSTSPAGSDVPATQPTDRPE
jgi:hypothetical protein